MPNLSGYSCQVSANPSLPHARAITDDPSRPQGRNVALKFVPAEAIDNPDAKERFIAMEMLEGETLRQRIARGKLKTEELLDLAIWIAGALNAAHSNSIIHRDIKPANILVTQSGQMKVPDFELAELPAGRKAAAE